MEESLPLSPALAGEAAPERRFRLQDRLFAWLLLLFGYCFWLLFPFLQKPLASALLIAALYAFTFFVPLRGRCRFDLCAKLVFLSAALALLAALIWADRFHAFICFAYLLAAYAYLVLAGTGGTLEGGWSELLGADLLRAWFIFPFSSFGALFPALLLPQGKGFGRTLLKIALGLFLAVLPTWLVLSLLSYDSGFTELLARIFSLRIDDPGMILLRFCFGVPVALYVFGLYFSSVSGKLLREDGARRVRERAERRRILPPLSAAAAVIPLLFVYVLFFLSQWGYYTSAFTGVLPAHLSYAEYARSGFFQLCTVAFVNFLVLLALSRLVRRGRERFMRALCVTLTLFTLLLIATALSKLRLYIAAYGLTPDRVHAAWFMLLLSLLFLLVLIRQFSPRFNAFPIAAALCVAMFLLLALSGSNGWIARRNVERYLRGEAEQIDVYALCDLGDDAVPELLRLDRYLAEKGERDETLRAFLRGRAAEKRDIWSCTLSSLRAGRLLEQAGYMQKESPP